MAKTIGKLDKIKQLKCKIFDSAIYFADPDDILPKITEWDMNILETIIQEIDSYEESAGGQVETGLVISYSSTISKKISDEEILLAFQQKYSYLSDSSNMQNITNRIVEELIIINDSDDLSERSQVLADNLPSEEEKEN